MGDNVKLPILAMANPYSLKEIDFPWESFDLEVTLTDELGGGYTETTGWEVVNPDNEQARWIEERGRGFGLPISFDAHRHKLLLAAPLGVRFVNTCDVVKDFLTLQLDTHHDTCSDLDRESITAFVKMYGKILPRHTYPINQIYYFNEIKKIWLEFQSRYSNYLRGHQPALSDIEYWIDKMRLESSVLPIPNTKLGGYTRKESPTVPMGTIRFVNISLIAEVLSQVNRFAKEGDPVFGPLSEDLGVCTFCGRIAYVARQRSSPVHCQTQQCQTQARQYRRRQKYQDDHQYQELEKSVLEMQGDATGRNSQQL